MLLKTKFIQQLRTSFPGLQNKPLENLVSDNLLSPFVVELPPEALTQAQDFIQNIFSVRELPAYKAQLQSQIDSHGLVDPGNKSIMMSYDFHLDESNTLKLIEINTNASFLGLGVEMYKTHQLPLPVADFSYEEIRQSILTEMHLFGKTPSEPLQIVTTDETPESQRLYAEFLLYHELFQSWGWKSKILDYREVFEKSSPDFIYNRHTDFFLSSALSLPLKEKFLNKAACFSPNPYEYLLLADKNRMVEWSQANFFEGLGLSGAASESLRKHIPRAIDLSPENKDAIWSQRKKYFFKPMNAFGSKQSYRGSTVSRKTFEALPLNETLAQEYVLAPEGEHLTPEGPQKFKYDLRCYAYQGRLQMMLARLYQGQVTNLQTPYGGFAPVSFRPV